MNKPITILDYVTHVRGEKETYNGEDHDAAGVPMFGGCYLCGASVASFNSCPTRRGFIACASETTLEEGFATVAEFEAWMVAEDQRSSEVLGDYEAAIMAEQDDPRS